jgi:hypothetical protein
VVETASIDRDTLAIFERTVRGVLGQPGVDARHALDDIGWRDFLAADAASVVPLVFGIVGERLLGTTALDDVAFDALGPIGEELRAAGYAFAHPRRAAGAASVVSAVLAVDGLVLGGRLDVPVAIVVGTRVMSVPAGALQLAAIGGIDPSYGLVRARGSVPVADLVVHEVADGSSVAPACRRALAHELLGVTDAMLATATEYAKVRHQFGQPIGAFQAVKHRLADVYVARQAAAAVVEESWRSDPGCTTVAAKALAAHAAALASEHCLQVLGAIGFTLEHDLHRFVRRVRVLDRLYGSEPELRTELGRLLQARGRVPRPGSA